MMRSLGNDYALIGRDATTNINYYYNPNTPNPYWRLNPRFGGWMQVSDAQELKKCQQMAELYCAKHSAFCNKRYEANAPDACTIA